jgi:hypothetical protein
MHLFTFTKRLLGLASALRRVTALLLTALCSPAPTPPAQPAASTWQGIWHAAVRRATAVWRGVGVRGNALLERAEGGEDGAADPNTELALRGGHRRDDLHLEPLLSPNQGRQAVQRVRETRNQWTRPSPWLRGAGGIPPATGCRLGQTLAG